YSVSYANLEIWFLGTVNDSGVTKARLLLKAFAPIPSPSASPPPFFFINVTAPQANEVIYDAFARVEGFARANAGEEITAVEVSVDGGAHWSAASGTNSWNWSWTTPAEGAVEIRVRARTGSGRNAAAGPVRVFVSPCKKLIYNNCDADTSTCQSINLVFAPSKYNSAAEFRSAIDAALSRLFSKTPFADNPQKINKINIWYYAYNFNCEHNGRLWLCETPQNYIEACGSLAQATAVIVNNNTYGGSANPQIHLLAFNSGNPELFPHEAGHAIFGLADRYCCDGGYWPEQPNPEFKPNLWPDNPASCSTYVTALLGRPTQCRGIRTYPITITSAKTLLFTQQMHAWFEQPADSNMQTLAYDFDDSDVARINYVLEHGLQS
ncbi:MAG: Ig-like domain-containing protein, partial [Candidatus Micrarchaeota archaeon]